jgi:eukaryotic-like serine/threonine-protein kinase
VIEPGTLVGECYRLDEPIDGPHGGWRAFDTLLDRTVRVRSLWPDPEADAAFRIRANLRACATVTHPDLVEILDYGNDPNLGLFAVVDHVEAEPLSQILARVGRLTPGRTLTILAGTARAMSALHTAGIVHRRIQPDAVLVRPAGTAVLEALDISVLYIERSFGAALGMTLYIAPELAMGESVTTATDQYALGAVGYQCLAGRPPFVHEHPLQVAMMHIRDELPPLPADVPPPVRAVVERALAKRPADRWPSAAAFALALAEAAGATGPGSPPAAPAAAGSAHTPVAVFDWAESTGAFPTPAGADSWGAPPGAARGGASGRRRGGLRLPNPFRRRPAPPTASPADGERLSFTAAYPSAVAAGEWHSFVCVVSKAGLRQRVDEILRRWEPELRDAARSSTTAVAPVARGTRLRLVPSVPGLAFNPERVEVAWHEDVHEVVFRMGTAVPIQPGIRSGHLEVHAGTLLLAIVPVSVHVIADPVPAAPRPPTTTARASALDRVFASYSRRDADVVDACAGFYRALGVELLMDRVDLRSGDDWRASLHSLIERADIFQLYWSAAAARSTEVESEWRFALGLTRSGNRFIRPVFWESPMPEAPADLGHLHFSRIDLDQIRAHAPG